MHSLFPSRGGLKLEKAMETFEICLTDTICMDIGASTGGFTDCMLQNGAVKIYSKSYLFCINNNFPNNLFMNFRFPDHPFFPNLLSAGLELGFNQTRTDRDKEA